MLLFTVYGAWLEEPVAGFALTFAVSGVCGALLMRLGVHNAEPTRREAFIGVMLSWLLIPAFGALPYVISGGFTPIDAMFESMSGFTTTGATVLQDFDTFSQSLFMWRAISQWFGGVGIIVLFIAVFPQLAIAGRQLFFAEAPGPTEDRLTPRLRNTAGAVLVVYVGLTILCALAYFLAGMTVYEAVAHAFTTLAAGGFSPNGQSFEGYPAALSWVSLPFMLLAGANFALQYQAVSGRPKELFRDAEFRAYLVIVVVASGLLSVALWAEYPPLEALQHAFFQVLSILTTTGYASTDFVTWSTQAQTVLVLLMFIGGSAGSAAGGIKLVRWLIVLKNALRELRRALHPRQVLPLKVGQRRISEEVLRAVAAFITFYILLFALTAAWLAWFGADFITALTASIACIGNIGPGLAAVGPMLNFAELHPSSRILLTFAMYVGRLEIMTVLVVLSPEFWRLPRGSLQRFKFPIRLRR